MKDLIINNKYRVDQKIANGGLSVVYIGTDIESNQQVAIKLVHFGDGAQCLIDAEVETYRALEDGTGIPRLYWVGTQGSYHVLVHELLGPSLEDLLYYCNKPLSLKTVLLIADQAICRVKYMHDKGYVHCDIKPSNFLMGTERTGNVLYAVDFGITWEKKPERTEPSSCWNFRGTPCFCSVNSHKNIEACWRDDLESLGYMLLYLARGGRLPWWPLAEDLIEKEKSRTSVKELCRGLPPDFTLYFKYVRGLKFGERPDYGRLRRLFRCLFKAQGYKYDNIFDWTEKMFREMQEDEDSQLTRSQMTR